MRIVSWNINALRAHEDYFRKAITELMPDIFCLQEIKVREDQQTFPVKGYRSFMNPAEMSQYYGTGVFVRNTLYPLSISFDRPLHGYDYQGRIVTIELRRLFVVCSYWPFSSYDKDNKWLKYRLAWCNQFQQYIHELQIRKPVIICGDMNMVHQKVDAFDGILVKKAGCFYPEERAAFDKLLQEEHLVDTYRSLHPTHVTTPSESGVYTAWAYSKDDYNRRCNKGFRIDYFLASEILMSEIRKSIILDNFKGSDHCPILLEIDD